MNTKLLVRFLGDRRAHAENLYVTFIMLAATIIYEVVSLHVAPGYAFNPFEFVGTFSGLVCVWLCRTRNILCWPWGVLSAAALGYFFSQIALPGQEWLNLAFFLPIQVVSWPYWVLGGEGRKEPPVTALSWSGRVVMLAAIAAGTAAVYAFIGFISPGSFHPWLDCTVTASSVAAQILMGFKKVENWWLWFGPVNALSIALFFMAGAYTLTALYVAFFIHAVFAIVEWRKAQLLKIA